MLLWSERGTEKLLLLNHLPSSASFHLMPSFTTAITVHTPYLSSLHAYSIRFLFYSF